MTQRRTQPRARAEPRARGEPRALIRDASRGRWLAFSAAASVLQAARPADVPDVIAQAEQTARSRGQYAVGFVSYEAAAGLERSHTTHPPGRLPPAWFVLFDSARACPLPGSPAKAAPPLHWRPSVDAAGYRRAIERIHGYIAAGDSYQVNFSYRLRARLNGASDKASAWRLFRAMIARQPGGYGAFLETTDWAICSASHELFFSRRGSGLTSRPMKGTAPRRDDPVEDQAQGRWLQASEKNRAENLMITDMVRSDLGQLARTGSVRTHALFRLERYPTLWQMTSTVCADSDASLADIFRALFPAASITGAPKRRSMEIIRELETDAREIYTGSVGLIEPNGDAQFSVAIRTAMVDKARLRAEYGVGGGILWDSEPGEEYEETRTKARILAPAARNADFQLLETLGWVPGDGYRLLEDHLARLQRSARYFGRPVNIPTVREKLAALARTLQPAPHRVRLLVDAEGVIEIRAAPLDNASRPATVALAGSPSAVLDNPFVSHKTTRRALYQRAARDARTAFPEADDVLLLNRRGEVTESTIANLVLDLDGVRVTPPAASGLLPGLYRQRLLDAGEIEERVVRPEQVRAARALYLVNSVRGVWPVTLVGPG